MKLLTFAERKTGPEPIPANFSPHLLNCRLEANQYPLKRLERLTALLSFLQSRQHTAVSDIKSRFKTSDRTVFRDMNSLAEAGVPFSYEKNKGYKLMARHFLAPLSFSIEQAKSFVFAEELAKKYCDPETAKHLAEAMEKIRTGLKDHQLGDVEAMQARVKAYVNEDHAPAWLHMAEQACDRRQVLAIKYRDNKGKETQREVEPIGITFYSQAWHLIGFCRLRGDYRDFSLSRIENLRLTGHTFDTPRLSLPEYIKKIESENSA